MKRKNADNKTEDINEIIQVYKMMVKECLNEVCWEKDKCKLLIRRSSGYQKRAEFKKPVEVFQSIDTSEEIITEEKELGNEKGTAKIESPVNGVFYCSPSSDSPPFVREGDIVAANQTVCIIEAMKLMNEIKAEFKCRIVKVMVFNAESVIAGQPIFVVLPL